VLDGPVASGAADIKVAAMTEPSVDPDRSRIVLIGTPAYDDPKLPDIPQVAANLVDLAAVFTDPLLGGFPPENCRTAAYGAGGEEIGDLLSAASDQAESLLLLYYAGHGLRSNDHELYLSLQRTRYESPEYSALRFEAVRSTFANSKAKNRAVIIDSCFSGRAIGRPLAANEQEEAVLAQLEISGAFTLTAAPANGLAQVREEEAHTAFTERLLSLLREGSPGAGQFLTFGDIYRHLDERLRADGLPPPQHLGTNTVSRLGLVRNRRPAPPKPAPLPETLLVLLESAFPRARLTAVVELGELLAGPDPSRALSARLALEQVAAHDHPDIASTARALLTETEPDDTPTPSGEAVATAGGQSLDSDEEQVDDRRTTSTTADNAAESSDSLVLSTPGGVPAVVPTRTTRPTRPSTTRRRFIAGTAVAATGIGAVLGTLVSDWLRKPPGPLGTAVEPVGTPFSSASISSVEAVAFHPDGATLAVGGNRSVQLWDLTDPLAPKQLAQPMAGATATDTVSSLAFSADGQTLAVASSTSSSTDSGTVTLWDVANATHPTLLGQPLGKGILQGAVAFSPTGHTLAAGISYGGVQLWDVSSPAHPEALGQTDTAIGVAYSIAFSPDGRLLAAGGFGFNGSEAEALVWLWNIEDPTHPVLLRQLTVGLTGTTPAPVPTINAVSFSPDGRLLAAGGENGNDTGGVVQIWDVDNPSDPSTAGQSLTNFNDGVTTVAFRPQGRYLTAGDSSTIHVWDTTNPAHPAPVVSGQSVDSTYSISSIAFSPDGLLLAVGCAFDSGANYGTGGIQLWAMI
jgi:WD40 repeat protein